MAFISTVPPADATGDVRAMYERSQARMGYVPNYAKAFSHRPAVMAGWEALLTSVRASLDPRRYELVTLAAARVLRSTYCALAHGRILRERFYSGPELAAVIDDAAFARDMAAALWEQDLPQCRRIHKEDVPGLIRDSKDGIQRVRRIVQDLKDFSRVDSSREWQLAQRRKSDRAGQGARHANVRHPRLQRWQVRDPRRRANPLCD